MYAVDDPIFNAVSVGNHGLPGIWQYMLPEDFKWLKLPQERMATCDNCPKVATANYRSDCKCCTYYPELPNFLMGLALTDPNSTEFIEQMIATGHSLPEGMQVPPVRFSRAVDEYSNDKFGKSRAIRCPFVIGENVYCGIYPYRNSTCSTFHCQHDHGDPGFKFWEKIESLVGQVEIALGQWVMSEVGLDPEVYFKKLDELAPRVGEITDHATGGWTVEAREYLFGDWFGREAEYFKLCADQVMTHRQDLYEIACEQDTHVAFDFERALQALIPDENRSEVEPIPDDPGEAIYIGDFWYKLQLAEKNLWSLPFNDGKIEFSSKCKIVPNLKRDQLSQFHKDKPFGIERVSAEKTEERMILFVSAVEADALRLFEVPKVADEQLLLSSQIEALPNPRGSLAEWLRAEILVQKK